MTEFFDAVYIAISGNISFLEAMTLLLLAGVAYLLSKKYKIASVIYSVFLILYITLLRREQGYNEIIRLDIRLKNAGVMVGNLLNLLLYIPFGGSMAVWNFSLRPVLNERHIMLDFAYFLNYYTRKEVTRELATYEYNNWR